MRKVISGSMVLLCLLFALGTAAADYTEGYFRYIVADGSVTITGYFGREAHVRVPAMIAGCPVNTIAAGAFVNTGVSSVTLPDTVTLVEVNAMGGNISVYFDTGSSAPPSQTPPGDECVPSGEGTVEGTAETAPTQAAGVEPTGTVPAPAPEVETTGTAPTQAAGTASVGHEEIEGVLTEAEAAAAVSADTGHRFSLAAFLLGLLLAVYRQVFSF